MIPVSFKLAGRRWKVEIIARRRMDKMTQKAGLPNADGLTSPNRAKIFLPDDLEGDMLEIAFEHELEHAVRFARGETDHDEVAVDGVAQLRHQYNKTVKYAE